MLDEYPVYRQSGSSTAQGVIPYLPYTVIFTICITVFEIYVQYRQYLQFKNNNKIHEKLLSIEGIQDKFTKSKFYNIDKYSFSIIQDIIMLVYSIAQLLGGYLPYLWDLSETASREYLKISNENNLKNEIIITLMFLFITSVLDTIISLPFGLYKTFVIEEKHGFNKQTMSLYIKDLFISFALTCVIGGPVIAVIITIIRKTGELFYWYVWLFMLAVSVFLLTIFPTYIQPLFNKFTPLDEIVEDASKKWDKQLPSKIKALADQVKFPLDKIFVMDGSKRSSHSNAYFYGLWNKRIVLFDTLNTQVTTPELLAILGHEIGHWKLGHTLQMFVVQQFYTFIMFLSFSYMMDDSQLSSAFGFNYSEKGAMPVFIGLLLFTQVFFLPVDKVLRLGLTFNSRYNEFMADKFAKDTFNYGNELASGLIKISLENLGTFVPDWLYSAYNNSHPTLVERLNALELKKGKKE